MPVPLDRAAALAEVLDVALASEVVPAVSLGLGEGSAESWSATWPGVSGTVRRHERLMVPDAGGQDVEVDWVLVGDVDHVVGVEGAARALAWRLGTWERRHELLVRLRGLSDDADADLDPV